MTTTHTRNQDAMFRRALGREHRFRRSEEVDGAIEVIRDYLRPRDVPKTAPEGTLPELNQAQLNYIADAMSVSEVRTEELDVRDCILGYELIIYIKALRIIPVR